MFVSFTFYVFLIDTPPNRPLLSPNQSFRLRSVTVADWPLQSAFNLFHNKFVDVSYEKLSVVLKFLVRGLLKSLWTSKLLAN